jgi:hypothetical protein
MKYFKFMRSRLFKGVLVVGVIAVATLFGVVERHSVFSQAVFHTLYVFPPTRPAVLSLYTWSLRNFGGGYQPDAMDLFLLNRLDSCSGSREERAILLHKIRQNSGRWGNQITSLYEWKQTQIISSLIGLLDEVSGWDAIEALVLIEYIRVKGELGKGWLEYDGREVTDEDEALIELTKELFKKWWADGADLAVCRGSGPLRESKFEIAGIP